MADDRLFEMLAQARANPDRWARDLNAGTGALENTLGGYLQGRQIKQQLGRPEAMARLLNATPQGHDIVQTMGPEGASAALYDANPKEILDYAGKQGELAQRGQLGMAGINERNTASQRAYDAATARTKSQESIFGGKNLSSNIADHENQIKSLVADQSRLASQVPGGAGGTIQNLLSKGGDIGAYLTDPKFSQIASQMKQNQSMIDFHQKVLQPMYRSQGLIPSGVLDNSDIGGINPPPSAGGDSSIVTGLPGFGQ